LNPEYVISIAGVYNIRYVHNGQHRDGNPNKSQWTITETEERKCFCSAAHLVYIYGLGDRYCWGLHIEQDLVRYLGVTASRVPTFGQNLFIAKFVDGTRNDLWHGYPADPVGSYQDIPPSDILELWLGDGYLSKAQIRKIAKGQICKLRS